MATSQKSIIKKKYGEFLPENVNPELIYRQWLKSIFGEAQPDDSIMYFILSQAKAAGIDPRVPRQIYAIPYGGKWQVVIGIEGLVTIAERTGQYGGCSKPIYEFGENGSLIACTIGVYKIVQGVQNESVQTVYFDEYTTDKNLWKTKPKSMLKKVALAHALRASFSACGGLYVAEELERGEVIDVTPAPDIEKMISNAKSKAEIKSVMDKLTVAEQKRAVPLVQARLDELFDGEGDVKDDAELPEVK